MLGTVFGQRSQVDAVGVEQGGGVVPDGDDACADANEQASRFAAHVTETLNRHFGAFDLHAQTATSLPVTNTPRPVAFSRPGAAEVDWLAGDYAGDGGAVVHGVGVHHPCHHFGVGADVRAGMSFCGPMMKPISLV